MKIQIGLSSLNQNKNIILTEQECFFNGTEKKVNCDELIYNILNVVVSWQEKMINSEIIDGLQYYVKIEKDNQIYNFEGSNKYPENFDIFLNIIKEIENC